METLFSNKCTYTQQLMKTLYLHTMNKKVLYTNIVYMVLCFATAIVGFVLHNSISLVSGSAMLVLGFWLLANFLSARRRIVGDSYGRSRAQNGGKEREVNTRFTQEEVTVSDNRTGAVTDTYRYDALTKVSALKDVFLLDFGGREPVVVSRGGFTKGDAESFGAFIARKTARKNGKEA